MTRTFRSGGVASDSRDIISMQGYATTNYYATFRQLGAGSGYQVPSGKLFVMTRIVYSSASAVYYAPHLLYGTSDVGLNASGGPTGTVWLLGDGSTSYYSPLVTYMNEVTPMDVPLFLTVAAGYYPAFRSLGYAGGAYIEGYLETV